MAKLTVTYFDIDDNEMQCTVCADDEAAAIGLVLDQLGDEIAPQTPFCVWCDSSRSKGKARIIGKPRAVIEDDEPIPIQKATTAKPSKEIIALFEDLKDSLGAKPEPEPA